MATDDGSKDHYYPPSKFMFVVDLGAEITRVPFQEVSGMDVEHQIIEYKESNSPLFSTVKLPGIPKYGNVTLKRGIFVNDNTFWNWYNQIVMNTIKPTTMQIGLLDESGNVTMQWQLNNARPTKIARIDLKSDGNEVAIDTIEIAHEQLIITKGKN